MKMENSWVQNIQSVEESQRSAVTRLEQRMLSPAGYFQLFPLAGMSEHSPS